MVTLGETLVALENLAIVEANSPTVLVGNSFQFDVPLNDLQGQAVDFSLFLVTQILIAAPGLATGDSVRLRLYRRTTRVVPQDIVAEFDGTSQLSDVWFAGFSNRRIELLDSDNRGQVHGDIRNTTGNSGPGSFLILLHGIRYPRR